MINDKKLYNSYPIPTLRRQRREGIADGPIPLHRDGHQREHASVHRHGLAEGGHRAQQRGQLPPLKKGRLELEGGETSLETNETKLVKNKRNKIGYD